MEEYSREPCPWRIIDDCGGAFTMGLIGGSLFNGIQGFRHAPSGLNRRTMGGLVRLKERAPVLGGQFAAWGLCFATFDCSIAYMRQVTLFLFVLFCANAKVYAALPRSNRCYNFLTTISERRSMEFNYEWCCSWGCYGS